MNTVTKRLAAGVALLTCLGSGIALAIPAQADPADATLTAQLTFMREEERLARDLYAALDAQYEGDTRPFSNITRSEQQHFDAVGTLLARYQIADPSAGLVAGDYAFDDLDSFYATLLAQGKTSLQDAYQAGITVEKEDIADLTKAIGEVTQADAKAVLQNLLNASENHLAAFERAASGQLGTGAGRQAGRPQQGRQAGQGNGSGQQQGRHDGTGRGRMGAQNGDGTPNPDCPLR